MKKILGLDLGTNSIGWALIEQDFDNKLGKILGIGSRIIPMSQDIKDEFGKGNSISQTADRTKFRGIRRLRERHLLRRSRLHRVLNVLGFLPGHYANEIDFQNRLGQFLEEKEPKLAYDNKEFVFKDSFNEMLDDFRRHQPQLLINKKGKPAFVPYDWTIYFLRKKALSHKISRQELAWIILNFNQKRGYYQLRGEDMEEQNPNKLVEFHSLKVVEVIADEKPNNKGEVWYSLYLENGWIYRRSSKIPLLDWLDKVRDFIVTTDLNDDGTVKRDKEGVEKRSFRAPSEDDWTLVKKKTEQEIDSSEKTVGAYIYDTLLQNPKQKIKGKLVRTIERKFYKKELKQILQKQRELQPELFSDELYNDCVRELYRNNEVHQIQLAKRDFVHLFVEDIIFYQRPLRSQKSSIGDCALEYRKYKDQNGVEKTEYLKAIPKSHPLYQEFRLWQWMYNLKIYTKDDDKDVTPDFFHSVEDYEQLFDFLNERKEVKQEALIKYFVEKTGLKGKSLTYEVEKYRWNYVQDKVYPCNETAALINARLAKVENVPSDFLTSEIEGQLWHLIYSVTDKIEFEKALETFARKHSLYFIPKSERDDKKPDKKCFVENFKKFPPFKSEYGSFSEKAIKKLLPLMRLGKYWSWDSIDNKTKGRIDNILNAVDDEQIRAIVREKAEKYKLTKEDDFQGLPLWLAQYVVYNRHSEASDTKKWESITDLEKYLEEFKQHSLRNPIVEQVVTETLRVVKDIWVKYGNGAKDFFSEIHIELGREMKNTTEERKRLTGIVTENENTNLRIKALLSELLNDSNVENVRPFSPMQQEALKVYEEYAISSDEKYNPATGDFEYDPISDEILKISKSAQPTKSELQRYKLWLEQRYRSPYTGEMIPLNKLFTSEYEIEHIIPQSRFFDDSFSNKIICESAVNKLKDKQLGYEFIKNHHGTIVQTGFGRTVRIFEEDAYQEFVKAQYSSNRSKRNKLLMDEIPDKMIERQLNDTRYISKFISGVLSNIVRESNSDEGVNSKNVLPGNGKVTSTLRQDWGLNDVWNELILPRFERMNLLTGSNAFTAWNENNQKFLPSVPLEYSKGFSKKRIDHRHHALDALVVACATRDHINLLNNQSAKSQTKRYDLQKKLRNTEPYFDKKENKQKEKFTTFKKPWSDFTVDTKNHLEGIVVSFKQNLRVINKTMNKYEKLVEKNGKLVKELVVQTEGDSWAIRKPMHKDTVSGFLQLRKKKEVPLSIALDNFNDIVDKDLRKQILSLVAVRYDKKLLAKFFKDRKNTWNEKDVSRVEIYYWDNDNVASRVALDTSFNEKKIKDSIADTGIQKILLTHLENYKGRFDDKGKEISAETLAFTPEGINEMNQSIQQLNNGKYHQPIYKVRTYESKGNKFTVGQLGNKKFKFVEAAKGTNLFFAIYQGETGKRSYDTIPLNIVIERQKQGLGAVPEVNSKGHRLLFYLSPNDLVYVPTEDESANAVGIDFANLSREQARNVYKMVSSTGSECHFIQSNISSLVKNYDAKTKVGEFGSLNKLEVNMNNSAIRIKEVCVKLKVDRLGNIVKE